MDPRLFGVPGRAVEILTSRGRVVVYRTELAFQFWDGRRFGAEVPGLWDSGADFLTVSERFAAEHGLDWTGATEQLGSSGIGGSLGGVFVPVVIRLRRLRDLAFRLNCQILFDADFPQPLLGNLFIRRNFNVETLGERRTFFRLREPAPDTVPVAQLQAA
jgi:hypothetical protein